jgi:mannose-6-phosphate isomerase-like protein (cupin superfamily)
MTIAPLVTHPDPDPRIAPDPPSDRSSHPAGQDLVGRGRLRPTGSMSFGALRSIAAGLARVQSPVPDTADEAGPRSVRLLATPFYDVWLITWPPGSGLDLHGHGDVRSVLHVVDGQMVETVADPPTTGGRRRTLRRNDATTGEAALVHGLANESDGEATTLHVYSPPLSDVTFHGPPHDDPAVPVRTVAAARRPAQATSRDQAPTAGSRMSASEP